MFDDLKKIFNFSFKESKSNNLNNNQSNDQNNNQSNDQSNNINNDESNNLKIEKNNKEKNNLNNVNHSDKQSSTNKLGLKGFKSSFITNLIIVFLVGVLLVIVGSMFNGSKGSSGKKEGGGSTLAVANELKTDKEESTKMYSSVDDTYKVKMEDELTEILEQVNGVGKVKIIINFENGVERVPVFNEENSKSQTSETDTNGGQRNIGQENIGTTVVMENNDGNQQPFISKTNNPTITGILIVAEGADDRATELRIRQAAIKLFGLEDDNVEVYPMKK